MRGFAPKRLKGQGDQATAVMGPAYLEHVLERVLKAYFINLSKDDERRMFDGASNGVLGSFSSKIRLAYAISLLGPLSYSDLLLINDIRNVFAHSLHRVSFSHPLIIKDCDRLQYFKMTMERVLGSYTPHRKSLDLFSDTILAIHLGFLRLLMQTIPTKNELLNRRVSQTTLDDMIWQLPSP